MQVRPWEMGIAWTDGEKRLKTLGILNWHLMDFAPHTDDKSVHT